LPLPASNPPFRLFRRISAPLAWSSKLAVVTEEHAVPPPSRRSSRSLEACTASWCIGPVRGIAFRRRRG
jgi:hypothetical protein